MPIQKFLFDPRGMHWPTYLDNYLNGTKKFVLKEDESGLPAARAHIKRFFLQLFSLFL